MHMLGFSVATHLVVTMNAIQLLTRKPAVLIVTCLILLFLFGWHSANNPSFGFTSSIRGDLNQFQDDIHNNTLGVSIDHHSWISQVHQYR